MASFTMGNGKAAQAITSSTENLVQPLGLAIAGTAGTAGNKEDGKLVREVGEIGREAAQH